MKPISIIFFSAVFCSAVNVRMRQKYAAQQENSPDGYSTLGTFHRCSYTGKADNLEEYLTSKQLTNPEDLYYGRSRRKFYFQHLFSPEECTNGLPKKSETKVVSNEKRQGPCCFASIKKARQCGTAEDWSVIAPDEFDGPGIMWRNERACNPTEINANATIVVDFFCPNEKERMHLHRCSFDGSPDPVPLKGLDVQTNPTLMANRDYYQHVWSAGDCSNGLPPTLLADRATRCLTSVRWAESCGADHDWEAIAPEEAEALHIKDAGIRWYSRCSMSAYSARIAVDYFCPKGPTGREFPRRLHRCSFTGASNPIKDFQRCENEAHTPFFGRVRHAGQPPPGHCMTHAFSDTECSNGLPEGECVTSLHRFKECGDEKNWAAYGPSDSNAAGVAGVEWYNGLQEGPCGDAALTVDYYCYKQCVRKCENGGVLDPKTCTCGCPPKEWWTGVECDVCGATDSDCPLGKGRLDKVRCQCVDPNTGKPLFPVASAKKSAAELEKSRQLARETLLKQLAAARSARESANKLLALKLDFQTSAGEAAVKYSSTHTTANGLQSSALSLLGTFLKTSCAGVEECPIGWKCDKPKVGYCSKGCAKDSDCPISWTCGTKKSLCVKPCESGGDCPTNWVCSTKSKTCSTPTIAPSV